MSEDKSMRVGFIDKADMLETPEMKLPSYSNALRDVSFSVNGLSLVFIVVFSGIFGYFAIKGISGFANYVVYALIIMGTVGITILLISIFIAYKKWRFESKLAFENHKVERQCNESLIKLEKELRDKFIINVLENFNSLTNQESKLNGKGKSDIQTLANAAGDLVDRMLTMRSTGRTPEPVITSASDLANEGDEPPDTKEKE